MADKEYGTPVGETEFRAYSPSDRAEMLYDKIREYQGDVEEILKSDNYRESWTPFKNEMYEVAFIRAFEKMLAERNK